VLGSPPTFRGHFGLRVIAFFHPVLRVLPLHWSETVLRAVAPLAPLSDRIARANPNRFASCRAPLQVVESTAGGYGG